MGDLSQLQHILVEIASANHYDLVVNIVRLSRKSHDGRSITAIAVAAHEVAHALQHAAGDRLLAARRRFAPVVQGFEFAAAVVMMTAPVVLAFVHSPVLLAMQVGIGIALRSVRRLFHDLTLPVELDASFRQALPILQTGRSLDASDMPGVRTVLSAAALTYVALSLIALVNIARYPLEAFAVQTNAALGFIANARAGWSNTTLSSGIAAIVYQLSENAFPLRPDQALGLLRVLDALIDLGDRRSVALEQSATFRSMQLGTT